MVKVAEPIRPLCMMQHQTPCAPFPIQLCAGGLGKAADDGASAWVTSIQARDLPEALGSWLRPGSFPAVAAICRMSQQVEDLCLPFLVTLTFK